MKNALANNNKQLNLKEIQSHEVKLKSKPIHFNIDLTGRCNINPPCVFCSLKSEGYHYQSIDISYIDQYKSFLDQCEKIQDCSFGEPFVHPEFLKLVESAAANDQRFGFSTNGLLLTPDKANILIRFRDQVNIAVSVNAATPETYYHLTGQNFEKLINNLAFYTTEYKRAYPNAIPPVSLSFIVMKCNQKEVPDFLELAHSLGVYGVMLRHLFNTSSGSQPRSEFGYHFVYENEILDLPQYQSIGDSAKRQAQQLGLNLTVNWESSASEINNLAEPGVAIPCLFPWKFLFVQEHSKHVYICCYTNMAVGSIENQKLDDIWNGATVKEMRKKLIEGKIPGFCLSHGVYCPLVLEHHKEKQAERIQAIADRLEMGINDHELIEPDWHDLENFPPYARWTKRKSSFKIKTADKSHICMEVLSNHPHIKRNPITGYIEINGKLSENFKLTKARWTTLKFKIPAECNSAAILDITIVIDNPWTPSRISDSNDQRELGIAVHRVWMTD